MKGIEAPPVSESFSADPVELFFDLAYVLAFSQIVDVIARAPNWAGIGRAALLFGLLWLPWQQLTWAANAVSGRSPAARLIMLAATAVSIPMAASTSSAFDEGGPVFAVTLCTIVVLGFWLQLVAIERGGALWRTAVRWQGPNLLALVLLIGGSQFEGGMRIAVWLASTAVVVVAMVMAGSGEWIVRSGHFAERHASIVLIALGEVVVAIGLPVFDTLSHGEAIPHRLVVALVASGAFAGLLWWGYFDRLAPALEYRGDGIEGDRARGRYMRDVYTWAHVPIVVGVVGCAVALEAITLHHTDQVALAFRMVFLGGLVMSAVGTSAATLRAFGKIPVERVASLVVLTPLLALAGGLNGVVLLVVIDVVMAASLAVERRRLSS